VLDEPAPPPDFTVRYGEGPEHIADVRLPAGGPAPLVLFVHGGFWREAYDRTHAGPLATALAAAGFAVALPEYRRVGRRTGGWPETFDDVEAAARAVPGLVAERAEVDLDRIVLAGHSAGGQLALWAAARLRAAKPPVRAVVALAAVCDLAAAHRLGLGDHAVRAVLGGGPTEVPERYAATDPMALLPLGTPVVLVHGGRDRQVPWELSRTYAAAALAAGDPVQLVDLPDVDHFEVIDPQSRVWPEIVGAFADAAGPDPRR
jgi:acetyl esterase/lipase